MGSRIFLGLSALLWLPYGIFCLVQPSFLAGAAGILGKIVTGRKGSGRFEAVTRGVAAHSGVRHQDGRSAIR